MRKFWMITVAATAAALAIAAQSASARQVNDAALTEWKGVAVSPTAAVFE